MANKLVIMSIYTLNWESVMNLNNIRLNIDEKTIEKNKKRKKRKKQIKNRFFHKKTFFIEIKNQKIKNGFLPNTNQELPSLRVWVPKAPVSRAHRATPDSGIV